MRNATLWRAALLGVEKTVIESIENDEDAQVLLADVRPTRRASSRSGRCQRRSPWYDHGEGRRRWRALDLGAIQVWLEADAPRVNCREHGPTVRAVPWARHAAGHTFIADRVTRNVVHAALGQPVLDLPSTWDVYLVLGLVALLLLGAAAWGLWRAARVASSPSRLRHPIRGWAGVLVGTLGAGLLVMVPTLSYGWSGLWTWAPDLALVIAALALLLAATAVLQATGLLRAHRAPHQPT